ncbi:hypothetical protein [Stutzerimonas frequens]|uniref:hypothetical protein n=1 Tax=Pseudomonas phage PS-1 TaxID=1573458 RepID=UPI00065C273A|nr:hypothetical protein [Stutzerimonas frequens]YP_009222773.1 hypothetical protein AXI79_gp03 [Pseudomonas phage PS-1]MBK3870947.1 hypothetical protein [Stutzerimonas frequens]MBK3909284.1 hypothetical protein [Stutzerimonas frequens]BAR92341.1 hypothetical protein [Pseudomonas phage PS-1]
MHTDKAIAEFEAWWDRQPHREQFEDLKQQFSNVAVAFYQKGREDLVVELPGDRELSASDDPWGVRDWCGNAIEAAGAKWRK